MVLVTLRSSVHNAKIMLGMLVKVLRGDPIATRRRLAREGNVTFEDLTRASCGSGKCNVLVVADAKELAGLVTDLPADAGIDPAIEQQIDQHVGRPVEALNQRDEILAVLR